MLLSEDEEKPVKQVVRETVIREGHNWGYSLMFFALFLTVVTMTIFFRTTPDGSHPWTICWRMCLALSPIFLIPVGYHYHVLYLTQ